MNRRGMSAAVLVAAALAVLSSWSPKSSAASPRRKTAPAMNLCKPDEEVITLCHPKGLVFALCGVDRPDKRHVVYRERRGGGPVVQFPEDSARYLDEFRFSKIGASGVEARIRFTQGGAEHYVVDAMSKGAPEFDAHGWPVNATALIVREGGQTRQYNCPWSDTASIGRLGYELIPREAFDDSLP